MHDSLWFMGNHGYIFTPVHHFLLKAKGMNLPTGSHPSGSLTALATMRRRWHKDLKFAQTGARQDVFFSKDHASFALLSPYQPQCKQVWMRHRKWGNWHAVLGTTSSGKPDLFLSNGRSWFGSFISGSRFSFKSMEYPGLISCLTLIINVAWLSSSHEMCAIDFWPGIWCFFLRRWNDSVVYHGSNDGLWLSAGFLLHVSGTTKLDVSCVTGSHGFHSDMGYCFRSNISHDLPSLTWLFPMMDCSMHDHYSNNEMTDEPPDHCNQHW